MLYTEALKYLYSFINYEIQTDFSYRRDLNLERMACLMNLFGHPETKVPYVLVGGTKGKGSTAYLLSAILRQAGCRVGLYTSPHLADPRERIQVSGRKISKRDFAAVLSVIQERLAGNPVPEAMGRVTFFELFTTAALVYFAAQRLDVGILEVGLGGRLDATNVVRPLVSIITPVSYDHQDKLGHTLEKIAWEKVHIVKERALFISGRQAPRVRSLFSRWAREKEARAWFLGKDFVPVRKVSTLRGSNFDFFSENTMMSDLRVSLAGCFQVENAACAVQAARLLHAHFSFAIPERAIRAGLREDRWPGRLEQISEDPLVLVDGAHNGDSFQALGQSMRVLFPGRPVTLILALSKEKDFSRIVKELGRYDLKRLIVTEAMSPRALGFVELAAKLERNFPNLEMAPNLKESCERAFASRTSGDIFLVTGSLFLVGEARTLLRLRRQFSGVS